MSWQHTVFGDFFLAASLLAAVVAIRASRRSFPGDTYLVLFIISSFVWTFTSAMEWYVSLPDEKAFWSQLSYFGIVNVSPAWLCYSLAYSGDHHLLTKRNIFLLWTIPVVTLVLALTNAAHGFNWPSYYLVSHPLGNYMYYEHGPSFWVLTVYCYLVNILYTVVMVRQSKRMFSVYRAQSVVLFISVMLPWLGNILYNSRVVTIIDLTPAAFTFTGALLLWNMKQYRLFDIAPIARETLFAQFRQIAIVLDYQNVIVDMNPFGLHYFRFGKTPAGKSAAEAFHFWPEIISFLRADNIAELEIPLHREESVKWFLVSRTPLSASHATGTGSLLICRDITVQKRTEMEREMLISELQEALASVKTLGGLLPICASCKKIRDDEGYWSQVDQYIAKHTDTRFTHGICPECGKKALDDYYKTKQGIKKS